MAKPLFLPPQPIAGATATSTAAGAAGNVGNDYAGVVWRSGVGNEATIVIDLGGDYAANAIMLLGVDGTGLLAGTLDYRLATSAQGPAFSGVVTGSGVGTGNYWTGANPPIFTGPDRLAGGKGVTFFTWDSGPPAAIRYVALRFSGLGAGGQIELARAVIAKRIELERGFSYGASFGTRDLGTLDFNRRGVLLRARGRKLRTVGLTFSHVRKDELTALTRPLLEGFGNTEPLGLVTDPVADAYRTNRCYFGALVGDLAHAWRNPAAFETKVNLVSLF